MLRISWDTNVLPDWAADAADAADAAGGAVTARTAVADGVRSGRVRLVLSAIVLAEYLPVRTPPADAAEIDDLLGEPGVVVESVTPALARRAAGLREAGFRMTPPRRLRTPDALVPATAATAAADRLESTDPHVRGFDGHPLLAGLRVAAPA